MTSASQEVILAAAIGVTIGWPVAGIALLPFALYVLVAPKLLRSVALLFASLSTLLLAIFACDYFYYGRPTVRPLNCPGSCAFTTLGFGFHAFYAN